MSEGSSAALDPLLGMTVAGRYRILSLIARGGMGKVYKAEQSALGRICAVKVLVPGEQAEKDPDFYKRFSREASTAAKLTHPSSVTIFDYGKDEDLGIYFIAMEYLDGRTLHRVLHEEGPLDEARVNRIAQGICRSLSEAHGLGLVHRDLKPGNVLLMDCGDEKELVKVLDFGLVKDTSAQGDDLTQTGLFIGSPKYTAPEQVMGAEISARSDIYSLGVVLYELLTGKPPFDKKVSTATLMAHVSEPPPPFAERNPDVLVSPEMEAIVFRCLEKDPARRFGAMREVLAALKLAAGDAMDATDARPLLADAPRPSQPGGGRPSFTPVPAITGSQPRPQLAGAMAPAPAIESLTPAPAPASQTLAIPQPQRKGSPLSPYAIALFAAAAGGALVLAISARKPADPVSTTRVVESVFVPVAMPAGATSVTESNPLAGIRLVRVDSTPPGARVSDRGTEVCLATPCQIVLRSKGEAEYRLQLSRPGYKPAILVVGPGDEDVSMTLDPATGDSPAAAGSAAPAATPSASAAAAEPPPAEPAASLPPAEPAPAAVETVAAAAPATTATVEAAAPAAAPAAPMHFGEGMTRPSPVSVRAPVYTREARAAKIGGTVIAKCVVTTSGSLTGCRIVKGLPHMNEAVLSALAASRYTPITYQGRPVAVDYAFTIKLVPP
ncbi:MAG: TonB family protein [Polyangiaceae bacterium]|nr:TonB family protein [Polyangiaceae bacterium]